MAGLLTTAMLVSSLAGTAVLTHAEEGSTQGTNTFVDGGTEKVPDQRVSCFTKSVKDS